MADAQDFPFVDLAKIEPRLYQQNLLRSAEKHSTLVVLPTGLGKTVIALVLAGRTIRDARKAGSRRNTPVLMLAPTKPLVEQHAAFFRENLVGARGPFGAGEKADAESVVVANLTGEVPPEERELIWKESDIVLATPQVVRNDVAADRVTLAGVRLLVLDEAHRATGDYAYVFLAKRYREEAGKDAHLVGLTASPGGNARDILAVCETLGIQQVDVRTEDDADVAPYVHEIGVNWIEVDLPTDFKVIASKLRRILDAETRKLQDAGLIRRGNYVSTGDILRARDAINASLARLPPSQKGKWWGYATAQAKAMKINHALEYIETQGLEVFLAYMERLLGESAQKGGPAASRALLKNNEFHEVYGLAKASKAVHPKVEYAAKLVERALAADPDGRIILFAHYRETGEVLLKRLEAVRGAKAVRFTGQATRGDDVGLTQKEQVALIKDFEAGVYNVLVATSVAEEGLDIPQVDHIIFYEPVPSEIRTIQRRGRTGRRRAGQVEVLIARKTRDEAYRRAAGAREVTMREELKKLRVNLRLPIEVLDAPQESEVKKRLEDFGGRAQAPAPPPTEEIDSPGTKDDAPAPARPADAPWLIADDRELKSPVADHLRALGIAVRPERLEVADFARPPKLGVERKTIRDFAASLGDGRLFDQAKALAESFERPVVMVEGDERAGLEGVTVEAFHGAIAYLMVDLGVAVMRTRDAVGSAHALSALARRAAQESTAAAGGAPRPHKAGQTTAEQQRFVLEGLPGVSGATSRRLLAHFGSIRAISHASLEEIAAVPGVSRPTAEQVYNVLRAAYPAEGGG